MNELSNLLEGLPIKVLSKTDVEIDGLIWHRVQIKTWAFGDYQGGDIDPLYNIGARVILTLMDEFEEPKKKEWDLGAVGGQSSDCKPVPKEEKPKDPFTGPQWYPDQIDVRLQDSFQRDRDLAGAYHKLADELSQLKLMVNGLAEIMAGKTKPVNNVIEGLQSRQNMG